MLCIGPFEVIDNNPSHDPSHVIFDNKVKVPYSRLISLLKADGYYAVVDGYEEHEYATPLPEQYEVIRELAHPRCPKCGRWDVVVDGDEMYCPRCRIEFWRFDVIWRAREFKPEEVRQLVGRATLGKLMREAGYAERWGNMAGSVRFHPVIVLEERNEAFKFGQVEVPAKKRLALGYVYDSCWDCEPEASFGLYEEVLINDGQKERQFWKFIRSLTPEEAEAVAKALNKEKEGWELMQLAKQLRDVDFVLRHELYKLDSFSYYNFEKFDDGRIKEARAKYLRELLPTLEGTRKKWALEELVKYGDEEAKKELERIEEEERRRREEERKKELEEKRKRRDHILAELQGLPIEVQEDPGSLWYVLHIRLKRRVADSEFHRFLGVMKKYKGRFDPKDKRWTIYL